MILFEPFGQTMDLPQFALGANQLNSGVTLDETGQSKHP